MYVDGVYRSKKDGTVGTINNTFPMTVGGKIDCDQVDVTCDYFTGQVDYLKITKGPNQSAVGGDDDQLPVADVHLQRDCEQRP